MCGLVGVAGKIFQAHEKAFRTMLLLDVIRGEHSTGVASIHNNDEVTVAKEVGNPFNLFESKEWGNIKKYFSRALIGHNRYATVGGITRETAHPFELDTLVGVHNGTLKNHHRLKDSHKFKVDSENLYHHMEKEGLADLMEYLDGAWALVWWSKTYNSLNFLRNKERPLWLAWTEDNATLFWASEPWMIEVAAARHYIKIHKPYSLGEDSHVSIEIDAKGDMKKPHAKHLPSKVIPFFPKWGGHSSTPFKRVLRIGNKSNVTPFPNVQEPKVNITPASIAAYLKPEKRNLEIVGVGVDGNGSRYASLMDRTFIDYPIRLYISHTDRRRFTIGAILVAKVSGWTTKKGEGSFFKVSRNDFAFTEEVADTSAEIYDVGNGHLVDKKTWEAEHTNCAWCFDTLYAEDHGNRLTDSHECLCGSCASDKEIRDNFNLKPVY